MEVARSGNLQLNKKARWCVLAQGVFSVYSSKADAEKRKDPKFTCELASCPKVACTTISSFTVVLPSVPDKKGKGAAKPGETLQFSNPDDNKELIAWANDLTAVWKALCPHAPN